MRHLKEKYRMADDIVHILGTKQRLWHTCKGRKLINNITQISDLTDNCARQLFKYCLILRDVLTEPALQSFRGQLDGCQWIFDFMRNTSCDIRPSSTALVSQLLANVFECHHIALRTRRNRDCDCNRLWPIAQLHNAARTFAYQSSQRGRDQVELLPHDS